MTDQELQFHLYLMNLPIQDRAKFHGRLNIADFAIPDLALAFEESRRLINEAWAVNALRIVAPDGKIALHLDYINSGAVNAMTFGSEGTYFVGLTAAMLEHFANTCTALWRLNSVSELLELKLTNEARDFLFQAILLIQLQFISSHELGHLFHGHAQGNAFRTEFEEKLGSSTADRTKEQAREVEADGYAVHLLLNNSVLSESGGMIYRRLNSALTKEDCILTLILLSIGSLFYFLEPLAFDFDRVRSADHPFALARMNIVLHEITAWCRLNLPEYSDWATLPKFQWVMACVEAAADSEERALMWRHQGEFLRGPMGRTYLDDLYKFQGELRSEMNPFRWRIESQPE
jgi:hypothetical protein